MALKKQTYNYFQLLSMFLRFTGLKFRPEFKQQKKLQSVTHINEAKLSDKNVKSLYHKWNFY